MAQATAWKHRPADGPIAWGVSVLVAPAVPLLSYLSFLLIAGLVLDDRAGLGLVLAPLPWIVLGAGLAVTRGRRLRGLGLGLAAGGLTCLVLTLILAQGGWR